MSDARSGWVGRTGVAWWLAATTALLVQLGLSLPAEGLSVGDSGVKLIAAFEALRHPQRPLEIDYPTIGGRPAPFVEGFFAPHGDHAHAVQSPLFPVLTAPLLGVLGLRGLYVLPLAGFVVLLYATWRLVQITHPPRYPWLFAAATSLASPAFFYSLEFWEHTPAMACLAVATLLRFAVAAPAIPRERAAVASGVLLATGCLLRPEAIWYCLVLGMLWPRNAARQWLAFGFGVPMALYVAANLIEAGSPLGFHAAANLGAVPDRWLAVRAERLRLWFSLDHPALWAGLALVAAGRVTLRRGSDPKAAQVVGLAGAVVVSLVASLKGFPSDSLWQAWPIGLLVAVPGLDLSRERALWALLVASSLAVWLTSPNDGGSQWGPRFLLIATPCLTALSGLGASAAFSAGRCAGMRRALVVAIIAAGVWTSRTAYLELRSAKRHSAELVNLIESTAPVGAFVVTDVWWLDQLAAPLYNSRQFLFVGSAEVATEALSMLRQAGVHSVVFAVSDEPHAATVVDDAVSATCYTTRASIRAVARQVVLRSSTCES